MRMQRTTMLALGLLRTPNRFRLYSSPAGMSLKQNYDTHHIDVGIAWHFLLNVSIR
jgi:hypothetical protein